MALGNLLREIAADPGCEVRSPAGFPQIQSAHCLPLDLKQFYELCGGMSLFKGATYPFEILEPADVRESNVVILGEQFSGELSQSWYTIARDPNGDYLGIDLAPERLGRCYDFFHESYGLQGDTPIIATSFEELLAKLFQGRGQYPYWLADGFVSMGDAYGDAT